MYREDELMATRKINQDVLIKKALEAINKDLGVSDKSRAARIKSFSESLKTAPTPFLYRIKDVWKAFVECRTKSNLDCYTCYADWGIGVIFKRKNSYLLTIEQNNFKKLKYNFFFNNYKKLMNIIEFDDLLKKF